MIQLQCKTNGELTELFFRVISPNNNVIIIHLTSVCAYQMKQFSGISTHLTNKNESYLFAKNHNLKPNIGKQANSRRIVKSFTAAAGSKQQNFFARGVPKYCLRSILYGQ